MGGQTAPKTFRSPARFGRSGAPIVSPTQATPTLDMGDNAPGALLMNPGTAISGSSQQQQPDLSQRGYGGSGIDAQDYIQNLRNLRMSQGQSGYMPFYG